MILFALGTPLPLCAQVAKDVLVRIRVVDTANATMENIAVSVIRGVNDVLASGVTDRAGNYAASISRAGLSSVQLMARKVGYQPAMRIMPTDLQDVISATLVLRRVVTRLDTVKVTADQDVRRRRTTVDAEAIAAFDRPLLNTMDVIDKMRPYMLLEPVDISGACRKIRNLYVNGKRVVWFIPDPYNPHVRPITSTKQAQLIASGARIGSGTSGIVEDVLVALATIKPEHIANMEYHDCQTPATDVNAGSSALFITLKEGVGYAFNRGSYVLDAAAQDSIARRVFRQDTQIPPLHSAEPLLERWRLRIIGIFDEVSGDALPDVDVLDLATGTHARTSETGTLALGFLSPGTSRVVMSKAGFRTDTLSVTISPADTLPLTAVMRRARP